MKRLEELKKYRAMAEKELAAEVSDLRAKLKAAQVKLSLGELSNNQEVAKLKKSLARILTVVSQAPVESKQGGKK